MKNPNPFEWLSIKAQKQGFVILLVVTLVVMGGLRFFDGKLKTEAAPNGIVSFEFAGNLEAAENILASWGPKGAVYAGLSLGLDFLFLFSYAGAIGLGCVLAARGLFQRMIMFSLLGVPLAWGQLCAALLDAAENISLIQVLLGSESVLWPALAFWCAIPKFLIVAAGLIYIVVSVVLLMIGKDRTQVSCL
jgi:hypothetical protein